MQSRAAESRGHGGAAWSAGGGVRGERPHWCDAELRRRRRAGGQLRRAGMLGCCGSCSGMQRWMWREFVLLVATIFVLLPFGFKQQRPFFCALDPRLSNILLAMIFVMAVIFRYTFII